MIIMNKSIRVDFAPGERIENAINDAMSLAAFTRRPIKFGFNGIQMTIDPPNGVSLVYKFEISPKSEYVEYIRNKVNNYVGEYYDKSEKRRFRFLKKFKKEQKMKLKQCK